MIIFRQKEYSIQEGHYSGSKSIKKIPSAVKVIFKSVLAGLGIGAGVGTLAKESTAGEGAKKGVKTGFWAGVALKILIDKFHKPMSSVKYQKVDKAIRKEYGIREVSGMIVGDTKEKRDELSNHFSFNSPEILQFKVNVSIQKKRITLYTKNFSKDDLKKLNESLDYYCYKYFGMEYSSKLLNEKDNSYSITIIFTNYDAIAKFLVEISEFLGRINVLDNSIEVDTILSKETEKTFSSILSRDSSLSLFDKYDLIKILGKGGTIVNSRGFKKPKDYVMDSLAGALSHIGDTIKTSNMPLGARTRRGSFNNLYLEKAIRDLGYRENIDYTVGKNRVDLNIYLHQGYLIMCSALSYKEKKIFEDILRRYKITITNIKGQAVIYTYIMKSRDELNQLLRDLIGSKLKPNIYTK